MRAGDRTPEGRHRVRKTLRHHRGEPSRELCAQGLGGGTGRGTGQEGTVVGEGKGVEGESRSGAVIEAGGAEKVP